MVEASPNQKRLAYVVELSTLLFWRLEIHSRTVRNFAPNQYPTKAETTTPENEYAHLQPVLATEDQASTTTRSARIPSNKREFRSRERKIPRPEP